MENLGDKEQSQARLRILSRQAQAMIPIGESAWRIICPYCQLIRELTDMPLLEDLSQIPATARVVHMSFIWMTRASVVNGRMESIFHFGQCETCGGQVKTEETRQSWLT